MKKLPIPEITRAGKLPPEHHARPPRRVRSPLPGLTAPEASYCASPASKASCPSTFLSSRKALIRNHSQIFYNQEGFSSL
jgi:hypothetical protein